MPMDDPKGIHEHVSLAIAMWSLSLPVKITLEQRQDLHDSIIKALKFSGVEIDDHEVKR